jgi:FlaA1/EpsC-like NDP-sugar epimerase
LFDGAIGGTRDALTGGGVMLLSREFTQRVLRLPRGVKRALAIGMDLAFCPLTVWVALYLRLGEWTEFKSPQWLAVAGSIALALPVFVSAGLYRTIFRYAEASFPRIVQAMLVYGIGYAGIFTIVQIDNVPRTIGFIQPILLFLAIAASRVVASWWLGGDYLQATDQKSRQNVMIYGAGSAGRQLFRALKASEMRAVGFIDDDPRLHGQLLFDRPIHSPSELPRLVQRHSLDAVLLAIPSASRKRRHEILEMLRPLKVSVRTMPGLDDIAQGRIKASELRELTIEDLLGRDPVPPDEALMGQKITGLTVLVTGAGGSIGSELCRQVLALNPSLLLLIDSSEAALYAINRELKGAAGRKGAACRIVPLLGSVCDAERMRGILSAWKPDTIYHAAAYKHVPLVEHNPVEGVWNNVFGTLTLATAAIAAKVSDFVLISTDKAVRPTNVMGASKRLAEGVLQALAATNPGTLLSMVRFGNVLGSSGSVVPLFSEQIHAGGPLTITHEEITRYFMTIPEAAQLVIQAGAMATGGEVFVLDMGDPVKIVDLARAMVELSGLRVRDADQPDGDIEFTFVGLRPGEKLYEELLIGNDPNPTGHPRIMRANEPSMDWAVLRRRLDQLQSAIDGSDVSGVIQLLRNLVPEYANEGTVVDWVHMERNSRSTSAAVKQG